MSDLSRMPDGYDNWRLANREDYYEADDRAKCEGCEEWFDGEDLHKCGEDGKILLCDDCLANCQD